MFQLHGPRVDVSSIDSLSTTTTRIARVDRLEMPLPANLEEAPARGFTRLKWGAGSTPKIVTCAPLPLYASLQSRRVTKLICLAELESE